MWPRFHFKNVLDSRCIDRLCCVCDTYRTEMNTSTQGHLFCGGTTGGTRLPSASPGAALGHAHTWTGNTCWTATVLNPSCTDPYLLVRTLQKVCQKSCTLYDTLPPCKTLGERNCVRACLADSVHQGTRQTYKKYWFTFPRYTGKKTVSSSCECQKHTVATITGEQRAL